jgi:hypothetical protein
MSIQTDQVRSRLEWLSTLSAGPEPSEDTKYLRKVCSLFLHLSAKAHASCAVQTSIIATIGELARVKRRVWVVDSADQVPR